MKQRKADMDIKIGTSIVFRPKVKDIGFTLGLLQEGITAELPDRVVGTVVKVPDRKSLHSSYGIYYTVKVKLCSLYQTTLYKNVIVEEKDILGLAPDHKHNVFPLK